MMSGSKTIMVAEDEESDVDLFRIALKKTGTMTNLIVARDGREVIDLLNPAAENKPDETISLPQVLLLDLKMPRMTGFEVLAWLRDQPRFKELAVLVLSSSTHDEDMRKARILGARDYFVKPTHLGDLIKIIQDIHAKYL